MGSTVNNSLGGVGQAQYSSSQLYGFYQDGQSSGPVSFDAKGDLFGACQQGGPYSAGTVYEITAGGAYKAVRDFGQSVSDGANPGGILLDPKGDLFGTCSGGGGLQDDGTVWEITAAGAYETFHSFGGTRTDGQCPGGFLVLDGKGDLWGTCCYGGGGWGTLWEVTASGAYKTIYTFGTGSHDGKYPASGGVIDGKGNLFGVCAEGGAHGCGDLFGACSNGGSHGDGALWEITASGAYKTLYSFGATSADGQSPWSGPTLDAKGDLFGTCHRAGAHGGGTVWEIPAGGTYKSLYAFSTEPVDGTAPYSSLTLDSKGDLWGGAWGGYAQTYAFVPGGLLWKLTPTGTYSLGYVFGTAETEGIVPSGTPELNPKGTLYGVCQGGGVNGQGTIWQVTSSLACSVLHTFGASSTDGVQPSSPVAMDSAGDLFGVCGGGGVYGFGTLWEVSAGGTYKTLYSFGSTAGDGIYPVGVTVDAKGNLFGTCGGGGTHNAGTVWEVPEGGKYKTLYSFGTSTTDGKTPYASVTLDAKGDVYGTCLHGGSRSDGTVWEIPAGGTYRTLYFFGTAGSDGTQPTDAVALDARGDIFGTCTFGGANRNGTVWEYSASGVYRILYSFGASDTDGLAPQAGVTLDSKGNLFGTTSGGGVGNFGTVWEITESGSYKSLYSFGATRFDGTFAYFGVLINAKGDLIGTCAGAGNQGGGMLWELTPN